MSRFKRNICFLLLFALVSLAGCQESSGSAKVSIAKSSVVIYGDSRSGHDHHRDIVNAILKVDPEIVFHSGDLVNDGNAADLWKECNEIIAPIIETAKFYPASGNHEKESKLYYDNFELPNNEKWYSVTHDSILFIVLNTNLDFGAGSEQYEWLTETLKNVDDKIKYKIALSHHPVYSTGSHWKDGKALQDSLVPLFEEYSVNAVFTGHDHDYERSLVKGIYYIVTGGGGAPLRSQKTTSEFSQKFIEEYHFCALDIIDGQLNVTVYNKDLHVIDELTISNKQ